VAFEPVFELVVAPIPQIHGTVVPGHEVPSVAGPESHGVRGPHGPEGIARPGEHRVLRVRQVPDLDQTVGANRGQVIAARVECDAGRVTVVTWDRLEQPAGPAVPHLERPISTCAGDPLATGAKRDAVDSDRVPNDHRIDFAQPLQAAPLPVAQGLRAIVEELAGAAEVVGGELPVGQCNPMQVRFLLLMLERVGELVLGLGLRAQGLQGDDRAGRQHPHGHQHGHCHD